MKKNSNAKAGALERAGVSRDAVANIDRDETLWAKDYSLWISFALCVASEAKHEKYIQSGDEGHHRRASRQLVFTGVYAAADENAQGEASGKAYTPLEVKRKKRDRLQERCAQRDVSRLCRSGDKVGRCNNVPSSE